MKEVFVLADNIVSPLGFSTAENFSQLINNISGVKLHQNVDMSAAPFYASLFNDELKHHTQNLQNFTKFEQLLILSVQQTLDKTSIDITSNRTALVISSTKGNISLLEKNEITDELKQQVSLPASAKKIAAYFGISTTPYIISHACISGLVALITAKRLLHSGRYDDVIVAGADIITRFILSGFQSFQAVSPQPCQPFDADRKGINLGEAAATIILSVHRPQSQVNIKLMGGAVSNDANHISGPSRTGQELFMAISSAMEEAGISPADIDFISAHGTATLYNDDMESKAIALAGLQQVPVNSLKGYFGHTLGAAGLLESVVSIESMRQAAIIPTKGFSTPGTAENINVCHTLQRANLHTCLKTASGFGGCNAAAVWGREV